MNFIRFVFIIPLFEIPNNSKEETSRTIYNFQQLAAMLNCL